MERVVFTKYQQFFSAFFTVFERLKTFESPVGKYELYYNAQLCPNCFSLSLYVVVAVFRRQIFLKENNNLD